MFAEFRLRRNTSAQWTHKNPLLDAGEPALETDTGRLKVGDGESRWVELDYFIPREEVLDAVDTALDENYSSYVYVLDGAIYFDPDGGPGSVNPGNGDVAQAISAHINSETPHPVYDDGPSFVLLYENAKV